MSEDRVGYCTPDRRVHGWDWNAVPVRCRWCGEVKHRAIRITAGKHVLGAIVRHGDTAWEAQTVRFTEHFTSAERAQAWLDRVGRAAMGYTVASGRSEDVAE